MSHKSREKPKKKILIVVGLVALSLGMIIFLARAPSASGSLTGLKAIVYRSATCGCCANYVTYLKRAGADIEDKITEDMTAIKKEFGIPADLGSCHTTRIGNYTVEGHMPVEAIQKLLQDKPQISGIALPQMPSGSPGMPGPKFGKFDISGFTAGGSASPYLSL